jgi:spore coat protein U-like protein
MFDKSMTTVRPFKLALLALAAIGVAAQANAATTTATASATVIAPIAVNSTSNLSFGKIAAAATPGSITISTAGTRTATGVTGSGTTTAAAFDITGDANATYTIDTSATTANLTSGANTMALALVSDFTGGGATSGTQSTGTLDGTGKQTLHVGGTLTVGANQAAGAYSGTVSVTVAYN